MMDQTTQTIFDNFEQTKMVCIEINQNASETKQIAAHKTQG